MKLLFQPRYALQPYWFLLTVGTVLLLLLSSMVYGRVEATTPNGNRNGQCTTDKYGDTHCNYGKAQGNMTSNGNFKVDAGHGQQYHGYHDAKTGKFVATDQAGVEYKGFTMPNGQFKVDGNNGLSVKGTKERATIQFQGQEHTCTFTPDGSMSCPSLGL